MADYAFHYDMPALAPHNSAEIVIQAACKLKIESAFDAMFVAVPNGTYTPSKRARGRAKQEGVAAGFPDAIIIGHGKNVGRIAFAEIKATTSLRESQRAMLDHLHRAGFHCGVFRSEETLAGKLRDWGWR